VISYLHSIVFENINPATIDCDNPDRAHVIVNKSDIGKIEYDSNKLGRDMIQNRSPKSGPRAVLKLFLNFSLMEFHAKAIIMDITKG